MAIIEVSEDGVRRVAGGQVLRMQDADWLATRLAELAAAAPRARRAAAG